jgi:hypothetical protein
MVSPNRRLMISPGRRVSASTSISTPSLISQFFLSAC